MKGIKDVDMKEMMPLWISMDFFNSINLSQMTNVLFVGVEFQ
jgi:hypothetical protein